MAETPSTAPESQPVSITVPPVKPGYRTTEFWLKLAAIALTALFASGVIPTSGTAATVAAITATMLGALGYTVSRSFVKTAGALVLVMLLAGPQLACGNSGARAKNAESAAVSCEAPLVVQTGLQLRTPFLESLTGAISGDGLHIDTAKLKAIAGSLLAPELRCAFDAAIAYLIKPPPAPPGAPAAAPMQVDPIALGAAWSKVRAELGWTQAAP